MKNMEQIYKHIRHSAKKCRKKMMITQKERVNKTRSFSFFKLSERTSRIRNAFLSKPFWWTALKSRLIVSNTIRRNYLIISLYTLSYYMSTIFFHSSKKSFSERFSEKSKVRPPHIILFNIFILGMLVRSCFSIFL